MLKMLFDRLQVLEFLLLLRQGFALCLYFLAKLLLFFSTQAAVLELLLLEAEAAFPGAKLFQPFHIAARPIHELRTADLAVSVMIRLNEELVIGILMSNCRDRSSR